MAIKRNNSYIHFRKSTSIEFASEFSFFADWLYEKDEFGTYINISQADGSNAILSPRRKRNLPVFNGEIGPDSSLNSIYFLDDIRVVYYRGVPYDSASDYITNAAYSDSSSFGVDSETHTLLIPKPDKYDIEVDATNLNVAYIHQLDETGAYNPLEKDASITVYTKGENGRIFTIQNSIVRGETTDTVTTVSYYGLKNYIDQQIQNNPGGGGGINAEWGEEQE